MTISDDVLLGALGKRADDEAIRALLGDLGLGTQAPEIEDGVSTSIEAPRHGVALFFRVAGHLRNHAAFRDLPPETSLVSDVLFSARGFAQGPGYSGKLPRGLAFADTRVVVHERFGPPTSSGMVGKIDRWESGGRYLTIVFALDESRIKQVTCGLIWTL